MRRYPPIADHGLVGDLQTAALVTSDGVVDWWCTPRFDSPSVFAALIDHDRGGFFEITAAERDHTRCQLYLPDTAILVTRFLTQQGVAELLDFMPVQRPQLATDRHRLVRIVRVVRGTVRFALRCSPRFDYGCLAPRTGVEGDTAHFHGPGTDLHLQVTERFVLRQDGCDVRADATLRAGESAVAVLTACDCSAPSLEPVTVESACEQLKETSAFWHGWLRACGHQGPRQAVVNRSAITLKLLTYAPTGAMVAAPTMGLPEQIGGERNWDYRYTWIRDAALSVGALLDLGFVDEADAFRRWLGDRIAEGKTAFGEPLQVVYRVDGNPDLPERVLDHLEGYRGSRPVRLGNGAADQLQLDIYGEVVDAIARSHGLVGLGTYEGWCSLSGLLDWLVDAWDRPDEGIWETRGGRRDFTFSRIMSWVAFDRGIRLAVEFARPADLARWTATRDSILGQVMQHGWSPSRQAFVQHYSNDVLDASLLLMPMVRFLSPEDPQWLSTLDAIQRDLVSDCLVYRYDPEVSPDGLCGAEGTFNLCSFLYVAALARSGRLDAAQYAFDKMLLYSNPVGLYAEEIGLTGEQLGNFPQAFTHVALISAANALSEALDQATQLRRRWR
ncbi:glycoside hydrolase family 15 protein [Streptomyces sp. NPDC051896]|uniref:glycoside hydrolase family 15 protein n=1 Tax=Streptomyces sp. NPDC051896 TaxID=3155416 RepID=UPI0034381EE1